MTLLKEQLERIWSLMSLNESIDSGDDLIVIGDEFAEYITGKYEDYSNILIDKNMTVNLLIRRLQTMSEKPEIQNLILSIGANDYFSSIKSISILCGLIDDVFPNANKFIVRGTIDSSDITKEEEIIEINEMYEDFYKEFIIYGFEVYGVYSPMTNTPLGDTNPTIIAAKDLVNSIDVDKIEGIDSSSDKKDEIKNTYVGAGDDREDFDTIYEFLNRFEKSILKTKNTYSNNSDYSPDVEQIQISLKFLNPSSFGDLEMDGLYGSNTESAISDYQRMKNLEVTGEADFDTNEEIFYDLKVKGFDDEDLAKFLQKEVDKSNWIVDYSKGSFNSSQKSNIELMIQYMEDSGIIDPIVQIGILSTIGKECDFEPRNEDCYNGTPNSDIRRIFGNRVPSDEDELTELKSDCEAFFNQVYGNINGNEGGDDGYRYRGRGFNGITGKGVYRKYGGIVGENLVGNPDLLNEDMEVAAKVAVAFFTNGVTDFPEFETKEEAATYFANKNAGDASKRSMFAGNAETYSKKFDIVPPN